MTPKDRELVMLEALSKSEIKDPVEQDMFMGQMAHETANFYYDEEIASGDKYENRTDLGNIFPGDGKRYKGRGFIQITGRSNYRYFGSKIGVDLEDHPERAKDPKIAAKVAIRYWLERVDRVAARNSDVLGVTKNINGGINGWEDRVRKFYDYRCKRMIAEIQKKIS